MSDEKLISYTIPRTTYREIVRLLDHIRKYSESVTIDRDLIDIFVLLKQAKNNGDEINEINETSLQNSRKRLDETLQAQRKNLKIIYEERVDKAKKE